MRTVYVTVGDYSHVSQQVLASRGWFKMYNACQCVMLLIGPTPGFFVVFVWDFSCLPMCAGITMSATSTRRAPNCFNLLRQIEVLKRSGSADEANVDPWLGAILSRLKILVRTPDSNLNHTKLLDIRSSSMERRSHTSGLGECCWCCPSICHRQERSSFHPPAVDEHIPGSGFPAPRFGAQKGYARLFDTRDNRQGRVLLGFHVGVRAAGSLGWAPHESSQ